jgi:hypothetical protein
MIPREPHHDVSWLIETAAGIAQTTVQAVSGNARGSVEAWDAQDAVLFVADVAQLPITAICALIVLGASAIFERQSVARKRYQTDFDWRDLADDLGCEWRIRVEGWPPLEIEPLEQDAYGRAIAEWGWA